MYLRGFWKLGERAMSWCNRLKIAIVEKNTDTINTLLDELPKLKKEDDIREAMHLLREASKLLQSLKDETSVTMTQIKKNIDFLNSSQPAKKNSLDVSF